MNAVEKLELLDKREATTLAVLDDIREQRKRIIKDMKQESIDRRLTRSQVAELLEYDYTYVSRLEMPFQGRYINYLDLIEWVDKNKPARRERMERNYLQMIQSTNGNGHENLF